MKLSKKDRAAKIESLRKLLVPGDTIFTVLRHVSSSGMMRVIDLYVMRDNEPVWLSGYCRDLIAPEDGKRQGLRVQGCGMDMGFHLVSNLSATLFPQGYECVGKGCPSTDHSNGDRNYDPHHHKGIDYAFRHRWI